MVSFWAVGGTLDQKPLVSVPLCLERTKSGVPKHPLRNPEYVGERARVRVRVRARALVRGSVRVCFEGAPFEVILKGRPKGKPPSWGSLRHKGAACSEGIYKYYISLGAGQPT